MESLSSDWDPRTIQIATLVEENGSVLEFGAGRKVLIIFPKAVPTRHRTWWIGVMGRLLAI